MERTSTSARLKEIMDIRGMKQIDVLEKAKPYCAKYDVKLGRSDLSQYVSGKVVPKQDKVAILAMVLDVSETWLMGYDVPMAKKNSAEKADEDFELIKLYSLLSDRDKIIVKSLIKSMIEHH